MNNNEIETSITAITARARQAGLRRQERASIRALESRRGHAGKGEGGREVEGGSRSGTSNWIKGSRAEIVG